MTLRTFTPVEANQTLPLVRRIVTDILRTGDALRQLAQKPINTDSIRDEMHALQTALQDLFTELRSIGCDYKDWGFELGLVDFPGFIDGQPVCLCWRSDEPAVEWYHSPDGGYAGRQPIPAGMLEAPVAK